MKHFTAKVLSTNTLRTTTKNYLLKMGRKMSYTQAEILIYQHLCICR